MRVLCYSPYNRWALHGQWEMTILHGLKQRGAEVHYVLCDGLYSDCDVHWGSMDPRPPLACVTCQADVAGLVARMGMEYEWLGRYLSPDERDEARRWAASLARGDLRHARYGDWDVAEWVVGSVHTDLRRGDLDVEDPNVERVLRSYLFSGLVACFALDRLIERSKPDLLFAFNGRQSSLRVAFELARRRGIRVVCHERGFRHESLLLMENVRITSHDPVWAAWADWGEVPLTRGELLAVDRLLTEREHGTNMPSFAYSPPPQPVDDVRAKLGLEPGRKSWVLFTSSDDELAEDEDWYGFFDTQMEWIERTVAYAERHPEIDLIIRAHPNTGSKRSYGVNHRQLEEMHELATRLPDNVRMVLPEEELSSYTLMEMCDAGLIYYSTAGLEMACKGKTIVVAANGSITGMPFAETARDPAGYDELLDRVAALPVGAISDDIRRLAYRFMYMQFFRMQLDFPLVRMTSASQGTLAWASTGELAPGNHASLDRIAGILLDGDPACPPPTDEQRATSEHEELEFFGIPSAEGRFTVLAFADELIADGTLLEAWAATFTAADPATLVIRTPAEATEQLVEAVSGAGLDRADTPDMVAVDAELEEALADVQAVFTRRDLGDLLRGMPRFDDSSTDSLRQLAGL